MGSVRIAVLLLAFTCVPLLAQAAELSLTNSTQYLWYQSFLGNDKEGDIADYLRLNVTKLDKAGNINIYGYARITKQVSTSEDPKGRLYYLYLDYRNVIKNHLDLKLGRTYVANEAMVGTVDGAYVNLKNIGPFGATAFGGRNVVFLNKTEVGSGNYLLGTSVYFDTVKNTHVEVSYGQKYKEDRLQRENFGLDFATTPCQFFNLYGRARYDNIAYFFNELEFGTKLFPIKDLTLDAKYYQTHPTFDRDSIYQLFKANYFEEISLAAEYQLAANYRLNAKVGRQDFGDGGRATLYDAGISARPIKDLALNVGYEHRTGYAGNLNGVRFNGEYRFWKAAVLAGIDYDDFRRDDSRDGAAKRYWAGFNYVHNKMFSLSTRVEDVQDFINSDNFQGFVTLNFNLNI